MKGKEMEKEEIERRMRVIREMDGKVSQEQLTDEMFGLIVDYFKFNVHEKAENSREFPYHLAMSYGGYGGRFMPEDIQTIFGYIFNYNLGKDNHITTELRGMMAGLTFTECAYFQISELKVVAATVGE